MEWWLVGTIMFLGLLVLLAFGTPIGFGLFGISLIVAFVLWGTKGWITLVAGSFSSLTNYLLMAAPLFIFMGMCVEISGLGNDAFTALEKWLGNLRGGLAIATVAAATVFGAATGFSSTGSAALGPVALPEMDRRKYDPGLALGAMGGGSALGSLIPPSVPLLMYGFLANTSVSKLFMAGVVPGILASFVFMVYIYTRVSLNPALAPAGYRATWASRLSSSWRLLPLFILILLVLGSLWVGVATPTEAAALGSFGAFVMMIGYRRLNWQSFKHVLANTIQITAMVFTIIIGALAFGEILSYTGFVTEFSAYIAALAVPPWAVILLTMAANLLLGCFLDTTAILFLTLPIYVPIVSALGFDMIWYGILIVINAEIGSLTPPVAVNLFVLKAVAPKHWSMEQATMGTLPYWFLYLLVLVAVALVPQITLWLPSITG
ncbi:MAG: TRAP transporter large permease [Chloroflexi bacterium]|nr:TRAP transporter large permease [Chloroflexota bacterium]